jgi:enediyne biosynthesis protein E5
MPDQPWRFRDPRWYQIACLTALLVYGWGWLELDVTPQTASMILGTAQLTQLACSRWKGVRFDPLSAVISALSLSLLLRANHVSVLMLAAMVAIASKFVLRWNDKHVMNPTNGAIVLVVLLTGDAWISPGQWGSEATLAFLFACFGGMVVHRSLRSDVALATLVSWSAILLGRSWSLGEPWTIPFHRLSSGSFLLFAFFMISDPKTTPDSRTGRILFAFLVCLFAWYWQFKLFRTSGLVWGLAAVSLLVPVIDWALPGPKYHWPSGRKLRLFTPNPAPTALPAK